MKIIKKILMAGIVGILLFAVSVSADINPPPEGGILPAINLVAPQNVEYQQYLGIAGRETFTIPEIKAEVVLIEIFSMY